MRQTVTVGRLFDIRVDVHVSWVLLFAFVTISIAGNLSGVGPATGLLVAALCALLLFASVIVHEFAHALVARRYGVRTRAVTLFLFGGIASLESEPPTPGAEVMIALAGPATSAAIAAVAFGALAVLERVDAAFLGGTVDVVTAYLAFANGVLAVFNLVPAFPMDGGRVLRAALWRLRRSRAAATSAASIVALVLAGALMVTGVVLCVALRAWQDAWYVVVGGFLLRQSWLQLRESRLHERLETVRVGDLMDVAAGGEAIDDEFALAPTASVLEAVSAFRRSDRMHIPVIDAGHVTGWLHRDRMREILDRAA